MTEAQHLERLFQQPEGAINLAQAALLVARAEYPELDVEAETTRLDELAAQAAQQMPAETAPAVKYHGPGGQMFLDPFHAGRILAVEQCREIVARLYAGQMKFRSEFLAPVDKRYILMRILNNLRGIYLQQRNLSKALSVVEMVLALAPGSIEDLKQRGLLHYQLGHQQQARQDLEAYLFLDPKAADAEDIRNSVKELRRLSALLN